MRLTSTQTLDDYVMIGNANTSDILKGDQWGIVDAIRQFHAFFPNILWAGEVEISPPAGVLSLNAYMVYTSAVRMALTGHAVSTFPLFRTALESACYAYRISEEPKLGPVWANRHSSKSSEDACRKAFMSAVKETARSIEGRSPTKGHERWINDGYQNAIDLGAHPNPRSVLRHMSIPSDGGSEWLTSLTATYSPDEPQMASCLVSCLDYGLLIAVILAWSIKDPNGKISPELFRLNDLKNEIESKYFVAPKKP